MALISRLPSGGASAAHTNRELKFDYKTNLTGETEVLSLSGKGRLYNCWFKDHLSGANKHIRLQIVVDGKTIANIKLINTDSGGNARTKSIAVGSVDWIKYGGSSYIWLIGSEGKISTSASTTFIGLSQDLQSKSSGSDYDIWALIEDYISFSESLVITAITSGANGIFSAVYALDN